MVRQRPAAATVVYRNDCSRAWGAPVLRTPQAWESGSYPLLGLLFCRCGQPFHRWETVGGTREYRSVCGCRLWPVDADTVERRVFAVVASSAQVRADESEAGPPAEVVGRRFSRIEMGGTAYDLRFVQREYIPAEERRAAQ